MQEEIEGRLDRLESRLAIEELASNYCHGFDKRDEACFMSIWWDDCVWSIGHHLAIFLVTRVLEMPSMKFSGPRGQCPFISHQMWLSTFLIIITRYRVVMLIARVCWRARQRRLLWVRPTSIMLSVARVFGKLRNVR